MAEVFMRKRLGSLVPTDEEGEELLRSLPQHQIVKCKLTRPRNVQHHRKFFALVNLVFENQERYANVDELLAALKIAVGHVNIIVMPNGNEYRIPKSIAFHKMDQTEFDRFYARVVDVVIKHFLPGVTRDELRQELLEFAA